jgi:hypothetical protein
MERTIRTALLAPIAILILIGSGCGSTPTVTRVLPENIMAQPVGTVGVVSLTDGSPLLTSLRALGIPYRRIPVDSLSRLERYTFPQVVLDEELLEDERASKAYRLIIDKVRSGPTLILLHQNPETLQKLTSAAATLIPRGVEYTITLVIPRTGHPVMTTPNMIRRADLDSLSPRTRQLALGGRGARAVIAANLQSPDSSAALLLEPAGKGTIWYVAMPVTTRAAAGYEAEQKILANLLSFKPGS